MKSPRNKTGLTLIELLAALVISAAVAVAAMRVASKLPRSAAVVERLTSRCQGETRLTALLEMDLLHADYLRYAGPAVQSAAQPTESLTGVEFRGHSALGQGLRRRHGPAEVSYQVRQIGQRGWLVRRQQIGAEPPTVELLCSGVRSIRAEAGGQEQGVAIGDWMEVPPTLPVRVEYEDDVPATELLVVR